MEGIFAINKSLGMTSHDVVAIVRKKTGVKRVGHGGTLDPLATGVLVIAVGRENTKLLNQYVHGEKEYVATIFLGATTDTYDSEGAVTTVEIKTQPSIDKIKVTIKKFTGQIEQIPPIYSALKLGGQPAYKRARRGEQISMNSRTVIIDSITIDHYSYPILKLKVITGPGVYIRSLANDIGDKLGTGGYLKGLVRTRVANFKIEDAKSIEEFRSNKV